jgi:hypothetical protein
VRDILLPQILAAKEKRNNSPSRDENSESG